MLNALKVVHENVLAQITALERVVGQSSPCRDALSNARWRVMRASRARLKLLSVSVYSALHDILPDQIEAFRVDDAAKRAASAAHIAHWNIERILADWHGYQEVSAAMTAAMRRRIADEQRAFSPSLHRLESTPSVDSRFEKSMRSPQDRSAETPQSPPG